jgi:TctA family transporter
MSHESLIEPAKHVTDAVSIGALLGSLFGYLPAISALFTIVWMAIRIYETDTVQKLLGRKT